MHENVQPAGVDVSEEFNEMSIVLGLRRGDRVAFDALVGHYGQRLWAYVASLVGRDHQAVADVFQETMLAVAKASRKLSADSKLWGWLARIGHNQAALHWRRRYRDRLTPLDMASVELDGGDPAVALELQETTRLIRELLAEMNADAVALLTAKYIDRMSVQEIVEQFGGTTESVRSRLARARRDFRQRYARLATSEQASPQASQSEVNGTET